MKRGPSPARTSSLIGIAELHDLSFEYQIAPLLTLLSQEAELLPDLLHARPWLNAAQTPQEVLETLLTQEWAGFLARLGRLGPWIFAPSVADLQDLSGTYALLVEKAVQGDMAPPEPSSLLGRLRAGGEPGSGPPGPETSRETARAEADFWALAARKAARRRAEWAAGRGR